MNVETILASKGREVSTIRPEQHNRDIMLCLDASGSMSSADAAVVDVFSELAAEFDGERIGGDVGRHCRNRVRHPGEGGVCPVGRRERERGRRQRRAVAHVRRRRDLHRARRGLPPVVKKQETKGGVDIVVLLAVAGVLALVLLLVWGIVSAR